MLPGTLCDRGCMVARLPATDEYQSDYCSAVQRWVVVQFFLGITALGKLHQAQEFSGLPKRRLKHSFLQRAICSTSTLTVDRCQPLDMCQVQGSQ